MVGDAVLVIKNALYLAIKFLRPKMTPIGDLDELDVATNARSGNPDASFDVVAGCAATFVTPHGNHTQCVQFGNRSGDILSKSFGVELVVGVGR